MMRRLWRWYRGRRARTQVLLGIAALFGAAIVIGGVSPSPDTPSPTAGPEHAARFSTPAATTAAPRRHATPARSPMATATRASRRSAVVALAALPVRGRAPLTGYGRGEFGDGWATIAGCDLRDRILARDLTRETHDPGDRCAVRRGHLNDPYTAAAITYVRGGASEVDIDHVVALGDAWQKGAQQWTATRRERFANDPLNLLSVDSHSNRAKGDGDAATWLPPNKRFRCEYVARQIAVKRKYHAWVTRAEHDAMGRVLATCPTEKLPRAGLLRVPVVPTLRAPAAAPNASRAGKGRGFANCAAVRAAGLAPLHRGTPDYATNPGLDRDQDGLACE